MLPSWTSEDLFPLVCSHCSVHEIAKLSSVNKTFKRYLFGTSGSEHWTSASKRVCGQMWFGGGNGRLDAIANLCPWVFQPEEVDSFEPQILDEIGEYEKQIVRQLRKMVPQSPGFYGRVYRAVRLNDSVLAILCRNGLSQGNLVQGSIYFVRSSDFKLLRDMDVSHGTLWNLSMPSRILMHSELSGRTYRFSPIKNSISVPKLLPTLVTAFWAAFRGNICLSNL